MSNDEIEDDIDDDEFFRRARRIFAGRDQPIEKPLTTSLIFDAFEYEGVRQFGFIPATEYQEAIFLKPDHPESPIYSPDGVLMGEMGETDFIMNEAAPDVFAQYGFDYDAIVRKAREDQDYDDLNNGQISSRPRM